MIWLWLSNNCGLSCICLMLYTARCWARFIFQGDWKNWCFIWSDIMGLPWCWFLPVDCINNSSQDGKANHINLQVGKTWRMVLWFFTHFLNLKLLLHSEFFVCEYLLFKLTLVVACVSVPNYYFLWLGLRTTTLLLDLRKSHTVTVTTVLTVLLGMKALHRH